MGLLPIASKQAESFSEVHYFKVLLVIREWWKLILSLESIPSQHSTGKHSPMPTTCQMRLFKINRIPFTKTNFRGNWALSDSVSWPSRSHVHSGNFRKPIDWRGRLRLPANIIEYSLCVTCLKGNRPRRVRFQFSAVQLYRSAWKRNVSTCGDVGKKRINKGLVVIQGYYKWFIHFQLYSVLKTNESFIVTLYYNWLVIVGQ
jgi:hypothetical protein